MLCILKYTLRGCEKGAKKTLHKLITPKEKTTVIPLFIRITVVLFLHSSGQFSPINGNGGRQVVLFWNMS